MSVVASVLLYVQRMEPATASGTSEQVTFIKRKSKGNVRKRRLDEVEDAADLQAEVAAAVAASGRRSKAVKGGTTFSTKKDEDEKLQTFKYSSDNRLQQQTDQGATATLQTETQHDRDARYVSKSCYALRSQQTLHALALLLIAPACTAQSTAGAGFAADTGYP